MKPGPQADLVLLEHMLDWVEQDLPPLSEALSRMRSRLLPAA